MDVELRSIDYQVSNGSNMLQMTAFLAQRSFDRAVGTQWMWPPRLAVTAQQDFIRGLEEDHLGCDHPFDRFHDSRQFFQLPPLADVHNQCGAWVLRRLHQLGKSWNQSDRQIIYAVVAKVLESFQDGSFPR